MFKKRHQIAAAALLALLAFSGVASAQSVVPISQLPSAATPLSGTEQIPCVQGGITKKCAESSLLSPIEPVPSSLYASLAAADAAASAEGACLLINAPAAVTANTTLNSQCVVEYGSNLLTISTGVTLTINGEFSAPANAVVFANALGGQGAVAFNSQITCHPEWWGAKAGSNTFDNAPYIAASFNACPTTKLLPSDYWLQSTLQLNHDHRTLQGTEKDFTTSGDATRLVYNLATGDAVLFGPSSYPGSVNALTHDMHLEDLQVHRAVAVNTANGVAVQNAPAGIRMQYTLFSTVRRVWSNENAQGIVLGGNVQAQLIDFYAFRSASGANTSNDPFSGVTYDGSYNIGLAGGNASVYVNKADVSVGGSPTITASYGLYTYQGYTDFFLKDFETSSLQYGVYLSGTGASGSGTQDFSLEHGILDTCGIDCVYITGGGSSSVVNISDTYTALSSTATGANPAGILVSGQSGMTSIIGGQYLGGAVNGDTGVYCLNSSGVNVQAVAIKNAHLPTFVSSCTDSSFTPQVANQTVTAGLGAVYFSGANSRIVAKPIASGASGSFAYGANLSGTGTTSSTIDVSGIDPAAVTSGAANLLSYNSTQILSAGSFGTGNVALGNMSAPTSQTIGPFSMTAGAGISTPYSLGGATPGKILPYIVAQSATDGFNSGAVIPVAQAYSNGSNVYGITPTVCGANICYWIGAGGIQTVNPSSPTSTSPNNLTLSNWKLYIRLEP